MALQSAVRHLGTQWAVTTCKPLPGLRTALVPHMNASFLRVTTYQPVQRFCSERNDSKDKESKEIQKVDKPPALKEVDAPPFRHPALGEYQNAFKVALSDMKESTPEKIRDREDARLVPRETDFRIVGGGAVGLAVAYWLKSRNPKGYTVTVVERDPTVCP